MWLDYNLVSIYANKMWTNTENNSIYKTKLGNIFLRKEFKVALAWPSNDRIFLLICFIIEVRYKLIQMINT